MQFSKLFRSKLDIVMPALCAASARISNSSDFALFYAELLFLHHSIIRASVPLMEAALTCAQSSSDQVTQSLVPYFEKHIPEELKHDEWLVADALALGIDRAHFERRPARLVADMVGSQYYWIRHYHPISLLGYIGVLEGSPPVEDFVRALSDKSGVPIAAFGTALKHATIDPFHRDDLDAFLDSLDLNLRLQEIIVVSAFNTVDDLVAVFDSFLEERQSRGSQ